jgi:hypothetical protein
MVWTHFEKVTFFPPNPLLKDISFINFVASIQTEQEDSHYIRATLGSNLIHYPKDVGTPIADLLLIKIFLNSIISKKGSKFATANISSST